MFESDEDILAWYESQPRALTAEFLAGFPWDEASKHALDSTLVPVIFYMRDTEVFTEIYRRELLTTPTGRDPVVRKFLDRWLTEEDQHGEMLNRFLAESGIESSPVWREQARRSVPRLYAFESFITSHVTNCFGKSFMGTHLAWGAINEMTVIQGYRRLWQLAGHPTLERLLRAIAHEEALHATFFWGIARNRLEKSGASRRLARSFIERFWSPVGQGTKPRGETDYVIARLFAGEEGVASFDKHVTRRAQALPGLSGLRTPTRRIADVALAGRRSGTHARTYPSLGV